MRFILLHEIKNDDGIRMFFTDAWDAFVRVRPHLMPLPWVYRTLRSTASQTQLSPFYELNAKITSTVFDSKIRQSARRYL